MRSLPRTLLASLLATLALAAPSRAQYGGGGHDETTEDFTSAASWNPPAGQPATPGTVAAGVTGTHLLISEIGIRGLNSATLGDSTEFVEIYNPTAAAVDLSHFYLSDVNGYSALPDNGLINLDAVITDFAFRFPAGSSIGPGQVKVIAIDGGRYRRGAGVNADFMLFNAGNGATSAQKMVDVATNKGIGYPAFGSLTNAGEFVSLFFWNGASDLVVDVDMVYWGAPILSNAPALKTTGTCFDGPDPGPSMSCYRSDAGNPAGSFGKALAVPANGAGTRQRIGPETEPVASGGNGLLPCPAMTLDPASLPPAGASFPYHQALTIRDPGGSPPYTFDAKNGSLPHGLHVVGSDGVLYGCDSNGRLFTIDLATGAGTLTGVQLPSGAPTDIDYDAFTGESFAGDFSGTSTRFDILTGETHGSPALSGYWYVGLEFAGSTLFGVLTDFATFNSYLAVIDPVSGYPILIAPTGPTQGLAWDAGSGTMYGIQGGGGVSGTLTTINLLTGAVTAVGPTGFSPASLEFGPDGNLYAGGDDTNGGRLYRVNKLTGLSTLIGSTGFSSVSALTLGPGPSGAGGLIVGVSKTLGSFPFTVNVTDAFGCGTSATYQLDVSCVPLAILPPTLPPAVAESTYSIYLLTSGVPGATFTLKGGSLPPGLALDPIGLISGVPHATGSFPFTVSGVDSLGCTGSADYKLVVQCPTLAVLPPVLPVAPLGQPYSAVLTSTGRPPLACDVKGGTLPPGLMLDPGGKLGGIPTATGTYGFTVGVTDSLGCRAVRDYQIKVLVCPVITIAPASLPVAPVGQAYLQVLTPSAGTPPFLFTSKDSLPPGISLSGGGTRLYGCDAAGAIFTVDLATGAGTFAGMYAPVGSCTEIEHDFTTGLTFAQGADGAFYGARFDPLTHVVFGSVYDGASFQGLEYVGSTLYATTVGLSHGPSTLSILDATNGGSIPIGATGRGPIAGLAYDAKSGIMYGIDGGGRSGPASLLTLDLGSGAATVVGSTGITAGSLEFGPDGDLYAGGDAVNGGNLYRIDRITGAATLVGPTGFYSVTGLTLGPGGPGATGVISGIPTVPGSYPLHINVADADGCPASIEYKLEVTCPAITLAPETLPGAEVKIPYHEVVTASGGTPSYFYSVSGSLPPGLGLGADSLTNATIQGVPTQAGKFAFTIRAQDASGCVGERAYSIFVGCPVIALDPATLPDGITQTAYSQVVAPTAGTPPFTAVVKGGALPPGLSLKQVPAPLTRAQLEPGARALAQHSAAHFAPPHLEHGESITGVSRPAGVVANSISVANDSTKGPRVLFAMADLDDPAYRAAIAALIGGTVDFFECSPALGGTTPAPELLASYDCVFTRPNYPYDDRHLMGDRLADYVDGGGKVILGLFCALDTTYFPGTALAGRIMSPGYSPVVGTPQSVPYFGASYAGDGATCLHQGVAAYGSNYHELLLLQGGGAPDGHYQDGSIAQAFRPDGRVIYSNGYGSPSYGSTGDWPRLIANAVTCTPHPVQIVISGTPTEPGTFDFTLSYTDANGCSGQQGYSIRVFDQSTPTLLSLFEARPLDQGLELRWQFGDPRMFATVGLDRGATATGPWTPVAGERRDENGMTVAVDRDALPGRTYYYRLMATRADGTIAQFGPFAQTAGQPITEFALGGLAPNPSAGEMRIDFAVPRAAAVRLTVLDVMGREVAVLADGWRPPGRYQATWGGEGQRGRVPAGLYFVRYRTPAGSFMKRAVVMR